MSLDDELVGGGGLTNPGLEELIIPSSATDQEPRVYIGQQDPIAAAVGQDAAIVFYWAEHRAFVISVSDSGGTGDHGQLHIWGSDEITPGFHQLIDLDYVVSTNTAEISIAQGDGFGGRIIRCNMFGRDFPVYTDAIFHESVTFNGPIQYGAGVVPIGGIVGVGSDNAASAAIGAAETEILLTANPVTFEADTAYEVVIAGGQQGSVANANPIWRTRKSNGLATGMLATFLRRTQLPTTADTNLSIVGVFTTTNPAPAPVTMALTMSALAGTVQNTATFGGRHMYIRKIGDAADFPNANVLT